MLLRRLSEHADRLPGRLPMLYRELPVRYFISLDGSGRLLSRKPTDTADPANPSRKRGLTHAVPQVQRSSKVKPLLLADNAEYTLGLSKPESRPERVAACHAAYLDLVRRCAEATGEESVRAVLTFLASDPVGQLDRAEDFDPGATITFEVDGAFPVDLPSVRAFWAAEYVPDEAGGEPVQVMQCVICGKERPVLSRLLGKVKGVPGGQPTGTVIVGANEEAFESYGLEASLVAPTCAECGERFTTAVNYLLANEQSRIALGGAAMIFWTREEVGFSLRSHLSEPDPESVRALREALIRGGEMPAVDSTAFYATILSGSGGRAVVRDWIDTTVGEVKRQLVRWFDWQSIVGQNGEDPRPLGIFPLAAATVRDAQKELAPPTPRALLHSALTGAPLPLGLLYQAVRRNRAEQSVSRPRAALIKLVLASHAPRTVTGGGDNDGGDNGMEGALVRLDPTNPDPAYHCGRLLAVLEEAQRAAMPGVNATIVDRFFGTASSAPASVFGRLVRGAQPHLASLRRERPGVHGILQQRLEEVVGGIPSFPKTLTLEQQGLFALGYYHQRAYDRDLMRQAAERRRAGQASAASNGDSRE